MECINIVIKKSEPVSEPDSSQTYLAEEKGDRFATQILDLTDTDISF